MASQNRGFLSESREQKKIAHVFESIVSYGKNEFDCQLIALLNNNLIKAVEKEKKNIKFEKNDKLVPFPKNIDITKNIIIAKSYGEYDYQYNHKFDEEISSIILKNYSHIEIDELLKVNLIPNLPFLLFPELVNYLDLLFKGEYYVCEIKYFYHELINMKYIREYTLLFSCMENFYLDCIKHNIKLIAYNTFKDLPQTIEEKIVIKNSKMVRTDTQYSRDMDSSPGRTFSNPTDYQDRDNSVPTDYQGRDNSVPTDYQDRDNSVPTDYQDENDSAPISFEELNNKLSNSFFILLNGKLRISCSNIFVQDTNNNCVGNTVLKYSVGDLCVGPKFLRENLKMDLNFCSKYKTITIHRIQLPEKQDDIMKKNIERIINDYSLIIAENIFSEKKKITFINDVLINNILFGIKKKIVEDLPTIYNSFIKRFEEKKNLLNQNRIYIFHVMLNFIIKLYQMGYARYEIEDHISYAMKKINEYIIEINRNTEHPEKKDHIQFADELIKDFTIQKIEDRKNTINAFLNYYSSDTNLRKFKRILKERELIFFLDMYQKYVGLDNDDKKNPYSNFIVRKKINILNKEIDQNLKIDFNFSSSNHKIINWLHENLNAKVKSSLSLIGGDVYSKMRIYDSILCEFWNDKNFLAIINDGYDDDIVNVVRQIMGLNNISYEYDLREIDGSGIRKMFIGVNGLKIILFSGYGVDRQLHNSGIFVLATQIFKNCEINDKKKCMPELFIKCDDMPSKNILNIEQMNLKFYGEMDFIAFNPKNSYHRSSQEYSSPLSPPVTVGGGKKATPAVATPAVATPAVATPAVATPAPATTPAIKQCYIPKIILSYTTDDYSEDISDFMKELFDQMNPQKYLFIKVFLNIVFDPTEYIKYVKKNIINNENEKLEYNLIDDFIGKESKSKLKNYKCIPLINQLKLHLYIKDGILIIMAKSGGSGLYGALCPLFIKGLKIAVESIKDRNITMIKEVLFHGTAGAFFKNGKETNILQINPSEQNTVKFGSVLIPLINMNMYPKDKPIQLTQTTIIKATDKISCNNKINDKGILDFVRGLELTDNTKNNVFFYNNHGVVPCPAIETYGFVKQIANECQVIDVEGYKSTYMCAELELNFVPFYTQSDNPLHSAEDKYEALAYSGLFFEGSGENTQIEDLWKIYLETVKAIININKPQQKEVNIGPSPIGNDVQDKLIMRGGKENKNKYYKYLEKNRKL
jgi:hypothetical protein